MSKNKEVAEIVISKINEMGFKPYDIKYLNGQFIFEMSDDSVVHFRLKGLMKNWKFGMWIHSEYLDEHKRKMLQEEYNYKEQDFIVVELFAQYDHCIDKFKPAHSSLNVKLDYMTCESLMNGTSTEWTLYELNNMLKMMKRHPLMCYQGLCGEYAGYMSKSLILNFLQDETYYYTRQIMDLFNKLFWYRYTKIKCFFARKSKVISELNIIDLGKENTGITTNHIYSVEVKFSKDSSQEQECKWLDCWFRRWTYGKIGSYKSVVKLEYFMQKEECEDKFSYELIEDYKKLIK